MPVSVRAWAALCRSVGLGDVPSNRPSAIFLPFSLVTSVPSSSAWASKRSAISLRTRWRRLRSRDHGEVPNARRAAATAARASASPPSAHRPSTAPVAGLTDSLTVSDQPTHHQSSAQRFRSSGTPMLYDLQRFGPRDDSAQGADLMQVTEHLDADRLVQAAYPDRIEAG